MCLWGCKEQKPCVWRFGRCDGVWGSTEPCDGVSEGETTLWQCARGVQAGVTPCSGALASVTALEGSWVTRNAAGGAEGTPAVGTPAAPPSPPGPCPPEEAGAADAGARAVAAVAAPPHEAGAETEEAVAAAQQPPLLCRSPTWRSELSPGSAESRHPARFSGGPRAAAPAPGPGSGAWAGRAAPAGTAAARSPAGMAERR